MSLADDLQKAAALGKSYRPAPKRSPPRTGAQEAKAKELYASNPNCAAVAREMGLSTPYVWELVNR